MLFGEASVRMWKRGTANFSFLLCFVDGMKYSSIEYKTGDPSLLIMSRDENLLLTLRRKVAWKDDLLSFVFPSIQTGLCVLSLVVRTYVQLRAFLTHSTETATNDAMMTQSSPPWPPWHQSGWSEALKYPITQVQNVHHAA